MSKEYTCPSCGWHEMELFYDVNNVPIHSCVLMRSKQEALSFPTGDIQLGVCRNCGFISNVIFDPNKLDYSINYEDQQCFSPTFNTFAESLANHLVKKYNIYNKKILEIGCGKGDFLILLCELGNNYGVGIDPAIEEDRIYGENKEKVIFIKDYYSERYADYHGDFVCCRHTLEHIYNTNDFLNSVRSAIGDRLDTVVFFEVPDVIRILRGLAFWDIYYEHCSYFSPGSLARLFRLCKFEVTDLTRDFDDQYLLFEGYPVNNMSYKTHELEESISEIKKYVKYFTINCLNKLDYWKKRLKQINADELKAVIWGSGSKCVSFMTTLKVRDEIEYIIDINPYRHYKFIPGVGKEINPPKFLKKYDPDITIIMNPIYCKEITDMINDMGIYTEIITVD